MMRRNWFKQVGGSRCCWLTKRNYCITTHRIHDPLLQRPSSSSSSSSHSFIPQFPTAPFSSSTPRRFFNTKFFNESYHTGEEEEEEQGGKVEHDFLHQDEKYDEDSEGWEEEDETDPEIGDGGNGGGVVFGDVSWGQKALDIANEVLLQFRDDIKIFAFKNSPRGYIYMRLDKLPHKYGCPSMEEISEYSSLYKKRLEDMGESGQIPENLALEVSSPGAERLLKVPDELERFREMPMKVSYVEGDQKPPSLQKDGVFLLESIETESEECVWRLADVKENRDPLAKGRPFSRKQKEWRLRLPFASVKMVTLYIDS